MASEIALALLPGSFQQLTTIGKHGGVLTAMAALGEQLPERLKATGRFSFESSPVIVDTADESPKTK